MLTSRAQNPGGTTSWRTIPVVTTPLGSRIDDPSAFREKLEMAGLPTVMPAEQRLWRASYSQLVNMPIEIAPLRVRLALASGPEISATLKVRVHAIGVVSLRYEIDQQSTSLGAAWHLNESFARSLRGPGSMWLDGRYPAVLAKRSDLLPAPLLELLRGSSGVSVGPGVARTTSLNTVQIALVDPDVSPDVADALLHQFNRVQGGSLGFDGAVLTSPHLHVLRWRHLLLYQYDGTGQLLALVGHRRYMPDLVAVYERTHVLRTWLKGVLDEAEYLESPSVYGRRLDEANINELGIATLRLGEFKERVLDELVTHDPRQLPFESNFARQLVPDLTRVFDLDGWKLTVLARLESIDQRNATVTAALDRAYQIATRRQGERLQLLFAGSFAATLMALLPALLALAGWSDPALPWVIATITGVILVWLTAIGLVVRRWRVNVTIRPSGAPDHS